MLDAVFAILVTSEGSPSVVARALTCFLRVMANGNFGNLYRHQIFYAGTAGKLISILFSPSPNQKEQDCHSKWEVQRLKIGCRHIPSITYGLRAIGVYNPYI